MKKLLILLTVLLLPLVIKASPMHLRLEHTVIIDTDADPSDIRAISLILSLPQVTVRSVVISGEQADMARNEAEIARLLALYGRDSVRVINASKDSGNRNSRNNMNDPSETVRSLGEQIRSSEKNISYLCLGPLVTVASLIRAYPDLSGRIDEIVWYNEQGLKNGAADFSATEEVTGLLMKTGPTFDIISNLGNSEAVYTPEMSGDISSGKTIAANAFSKTLTSGSKGRDLPLIAEELVAVAMANHELIVMEPVAPLSPVRYNTRYNAVAVREVISDIIKGSFKSGHFVAFNGFPLDPAIYTYDVRLIMDEAIAKYGVDEWKACVMTDEFHGHLGVYSIIGAKMGILAREYFGVSTDLLKIKSYAGSVTPFSCMNDGLQVSTGATLGQGTISLTDDPVTKPHAIFTYNNEQILIKMKPAYQEMLQKVIRAGVDNFGIDDEDYWIFVRQCAIRFWLEWDRNVIFEITQL